MTKKIFLTLIFTVFLLINTADIFAAGEHGEAATCFIDQTAPTPKGDCDDPYVCRPVPSQPDPHLYLIGNCAKPDIQDIFGKIQPPDALKGFLAKDPTGAGAISQFLSNFVVLIFSVAGIVLILMIVWGAFDWIISEGDKEKVASARNKIINAIIGIILFSIAFAIIQVLGTFTGFKFFKGQGISVERDATNNRYF